ncbi:probable translation initiation factor eIF-2B subunit alpha [Hyalella azteca]|uniref:Translation initiation factor eIF2B subunit alpha n=1 Tax=Hyalella azteca TaxID=294128 RepID=A0A8B7NRZ6_HYAAZ|nr:probable translation initiation factor eIF-2B subunit alpha [Hyalella azteca]
MLSKEDWHRKYQEKLDEDPYAIHPIAVMQLVLESLVLDDSKTVQELIERMKFVRQALCDSPCSTVSTEPSGEMFTRFITRASTALEDAETIAEARQILIDRGEDFIKHMLELPDKVAKKALGLFEQTHKHLTILTHSRNACLLSTFLEAKSRGHSFYVFVTEGRPSNQGASMVEEMKQAGVCCSLIPDAAMAYYAEQCNFIMLGAETVCPNGGIIGVIGTATMTATAKLLGKPVHVVAECYRFSDHHFPLNNRHLIRKHLPNVKGFDCPPVDYSPPENIKRLVSDIGSIDPLFAYDTVNHLFT